MPSIVYRLHNREMRFTTRELVSITYFHSQFPFVQLSRKDCYVTKEHTEWTVKFVNKGFDYYIIKVNQLTVTGSNKKNLEW